MFKNDYQGGSFVELFTVVGKDPLSKVKVSSSGVIKEFSNEIRSYVINIEGEPATTHISFPKSSKQSLHATQQYLVFQLYIHCKKSLSLEVTILNQLSCKKRILFSSNNRDVIATPLYAKMPFSFAKTSSWFNLCFDLEELVMSLFEGSRYAAVDSVVLSANCKLKRLFTLKERPDCNDDMPKNLTLPDDIDIVTQVIGSHSFSDLSINKRSGSGGSSGRRISSLTNLSNTHLAFGSRIRNQDDSFSSEVFTDRQHKVPHVRNQNIGSLTERPLKAFQLDLNASDKESTKKESTELENNEVLESGSTISSSKLLIQPRPPKQIIGKVRRPRVKSADLSSTATKPKNGLPLLSKSADSRSRVKPKKDCTNETTDNISENNLLNAVQKFKTPIALASELETTERVSYQSKQFRSKSLTVLPDINKVIVQKKENSFPTLLLADDIFESDYLQKHVKSNYNDAEYQSSCSNSTSSDLFLYSSHPRSISAQRSHRNSETCLDNIAENTILKSPSNPSLSLEVNAALVLSEDEIYTSSSSNHDASNFDLNKENLKLHNSRYEVNEKLNKTFNIVESTSVKMNEKLLLPNQSRDFLNLKSQNEIALPVYDPVSESYESDTMSWLNSSVDKPLHFPINTEWSPKQMLRKKLEDHLGSMLRTSKEGDSEGGLSDDSDDTTFAERPKIRNYRYQDEIKSLDLALDLSAVVPATPQVGEQSRRDKPDVNNNSIAGQKDEEYLDLLFDPVLNCYYDPKTEKYYELS